MKIMRHELIIIGGGIIGLATGMALRRSLGDKLLIVEAESKLAEHQTGHNSGVVHSGLYYQPGSLKARHCTTGREAMFAFCQEYGIAHQRCGKIVVATSAEEIPRLDELQRRGAENGLSGLRRLAAKEIEQFEPHARGLAGLHVPETGIVDYRQVAHQMADLVVAAGGQIRTDAKVVGATVTPSETVLQTTAGELRCRFLINCAGLNSDRVARLCGLHPAVQIVPFRGEYYQLTPSAAHLVRNLIYPVPDPRFPFLGVHFTRMIHGGVEAGPNAVLAASRQGYSLYQFSPRDMLEMAANTSLWKLAWRHHRLGLAELVRSLSKSAFAKALQKLVPEIREDDIQPAGAGVRAQALGPGGRLVDDFVIERHVRMIHVLNAPSPAATASIEIGETIAAMATEQFGLTAR